MNKPNLPAALQKPMIGILRGLEPRNALKVTEVLIKNGFRVLEVPLNSPDACHSIEMIKKEFGDQLIIGAGTVLNISSVLDVANAGGSIIVSPNMNPAVILKTKSLGLFSFPGVCTPTEAFSAIDSGADGIKFFPCESLSPSTIKAYKAVLPTEIVTVAVGGIQSNNMHQYIEVGISGFGFGSCLFKPNYTIETIENNAKLLMATWQQLNLD